MSKEIIQSCDNRECQSSSKYFKKCKDFSHDICAFCWVKVGIGKNMKYYCPICLKNAELE